jgi:hypothetical protein
MRFYLLRASNDVHAIATPAVAALVAWGSEINKEADGVCQDASSLKVTSGRVMVQANNGRDFVAL